jgi:N-acylneuraminate cytidylyltransferase
MVGQAQVLALVPARGGSKSIPRKNVMPFAGHPLLAYSIAAGLKAQSVGRVIVSTDDAEIASIARQYGAEAPFLRPASLAQDDTPDLPVFEHALAWLDSHEGYRPEIVVHLRPTSPIRPPGCVDRAVGILAANPEADSVRGVVPSGQNPYKMWRIGADGRMGPLLQDGFDEPYNMPRQALPPTFWQTGHVDAVRTATILEKGSMTGDVILPLVLDPRYTIDIDNARDLERAEWMLAGSELDAVRPGPGPRPLPERVTLLALDFDGVLTDDRVWLDAQGTEWVAAHRGDGWGIARLLEQGVQVVVLSTETNPVVSARCRKLGIPAVQGVLEKGAALQELLRQRGIDRESTVYVGNDVNDLPCFPIAGCAVAVADAHPSVRRAADMVLRSEGGRGAVRELCDILLERQTARRE